MIRAYRASDRDALADLWVDAWNQTLPHIDFEARRPWIWDLLGRATDLGPVECAADGDRLVGFITLERQSSHVEQLAVSPAYHGRGVADGLCEIAKARSPGWLTLSVNQDNPRAVRFYERHGFRIESAGVNPGGRLTTWNMRWQRDAAGPVIR